MDNQTKDKEECPKLPAWLAKAERLAEDISKFYKLPQHIQNLYNLHYQAQRGDCHCAEKLAVRYESGDVPSGPNMITAIEWHKYSVHLGSVASALRLAQLLDWSVHEEGKPDSAGVQMARRVLQIVLENTYRERSEWHNAAAAALLLLSRNPDETARGLIEDLLDEKKFADHPDFERIATALRQEKCKAGEDPLSLKVAQSKIGEDGGFKLGIYKCLESPLPLVPLVADVEAIRNVLDQEYPWFKKINDQVYRQMVVGQHSVTPAFRIRPMLLAGLPGVGKTSWAKRLAELCKVPFRTVMAGGGADSMFLRGTPRGWSSARPGAVIQAMAIERVANPIFLVDELEKASSNSHNGRIWDVLLQLLEPASSKTYLDECLQVPCDLSWVSWIATANTLSGLPKPLLERFTVVLVEPPGEGHFMALVEGAIRAFANEMGIDQRMLPRLGTEDSEILRGCKSPREINRTVRMMLEHALVQMQIQQGSTH